MLGLLIVLMLVFVACLRRAGAVFAHRGRPAHDPAAAAVGAHWFGTDDQGRDICRADPRLAHHAVVVILVAVLAAPVGCWWARWRVMRAAGWMRC
jgi:ABC-type dipeptide/oligopeptide/nickel transport system permease subunit